MAKQRMVNTKMWDDSYFSELEVSEKLLFIYLLTNTLTNISWIYEISTKRMMFDTWLPNKVIWEVVNKFEHDCKIYIRSWFIMIKNFIDYQNASPKVQEWIKREIDAIPESVYNDFFWLNRERLITYREGIDTPTIGYTGDIALNLTKPNLTKPNLSVTEVSETSVATKVATLEEYIKDNFTLDFISDIYNKYNLTKADFQEECEMFVAHWKEKSPQWIKERWQKEKTFDPKLRFRKWMKNKKDWSKTIVVNSEEDERKQKLAELYKNKTF